MSLIIARIIGFGDCLKISIITTIKDDISGFDKTAQSIINQTYNNIEYIVVDASEKNSIKKKFPQYLKRIDTLIEGADSSAYEGMNRGIKAATGDIIALLHSGDVYCCLKIISEIASIFKKNINISFLYGNIVFHSKKDSSKIVRIWKSKKLNKQQVINGIFPPHTSLFIKKEIYDSIGEYDIRFNIAADTDFMIRLFSDEKLESFFLDKNILSMRIGGKSNSSIFSVIKGNLEFIKVLKKHKAKKPFIKAANKIISKLKQLTYFKV